MRTPTTLLPVLSLLAAAVAGGLTTIPADAAAPPPTCLGQRATVVGTPGADTMTGTPGPDVVVALGGDDVVDGRGGDDLVCGGPGADVLHGGAGDDRLAGGEDRVTPDRGQDVFGDRLAGGPGDDWLDAGPRGTGNVVQPDTVTWEDAAAGVVIDLSGAQGTATGEGTDTIVLGAGLRVEASAHDDVVVGGPRTDRIRAGAGDDSVSTGDGSDHVVLDPPGGDPSGDDRLDLGPGGGLSYQSARSNGGRDEVVTAGGASEYVFVRGRQPVTVAVGDGGDTVELRADVRGARVDLGAGDDAVRLRGGRGQHARTATVDARAGTLAAAGVAGTSTLTGVESWALAYGAAWTFLGSDARDLLDLTLSDGATTVRLRGGDDRVIAGPHADDLAGGQGRDRVLRGGADDSCRGFEVGGCG